MLRNAMHYKAWCCAENSAWYAKTLMGGILCDVDRVFQVLLRAGAALHTLSASSMYSQVRLLEVPMVTLALVMVWD